MTSIIKLVQPDYLALSVDTEKTIKAKTDHILPFDSGVQLADSCCSLPNNKTTIQFTHKKLFKLHLSGTCRASTPPVISFISNSKVVDPTHHNIPAIPLQSDLWLINAVCLFYADKKINLHVEIKAQHGCQVQPGTRLLVHT